MKYNFKKTKKQAEQKKRSPWYIYQPGKWSYFLFLVPLVLLILICVST